MNQFFLTLTEEKRLPHDSIQLTLLAAPLEETARSRSRVSVRDQSSQARPKNPKKENLKNNRVEKLESQGAQQGNQRVHFVQ